MNAANAKDSMCPHISHIDIHKNIILMTPNVVHLLLINCPCVCDSAGVSFIVDKELIFSVMFVNF